MLENLITQYHQGHDNIISREITINDSTFQQTAHYLPEQRVIRNYIIDISEQKQLQKELKQAKLFSVRLTEKVSEGVIIVKSSTKQIVQANIAATEILGYTNDELLQLNIYELVNESEKFALILRTIIAEKSDIEEEYLLRCRDNSLLKAQVKISAVDSIAKEKICLIIRHSTLDDSTKVASPPTTLKFKRNLFHQQLLTANRQC